MSAFTEKSWHEALMKVYIKSTLDQEYRARCIADPIAALKEVSDIDLPPTLKFAFYEKAEDFIYPFLLPPPQTSGEPSGEVTDQLIRWAATCTWPTGQAPS